MQDQRSDPENSIQIGTSCTGGELSGKRISQYICTRQTPTIQSYCSTFLQYHSSFSSLLTFLQLESHRDLSRPHDRQIMEKIQIQKGNVCVNEQEELDVWCKSGENTKQEVGKRRFWVCFQITFTFLSCNDFCFCHLGSVLYKYPNGLKI